MFDGLNAIPWIDLTHAYGSAEEVPMWLRQLTASDEETRKRAIWHLTGSICHQGWISPATGYAVSYLIELLQEPTVQGKEAILELLAEIAEADPELDEECWRKNAGVPQWIVPEHIPFKNTRLEVGKGLPVYQMLFAHEDEMIRMRAVQVFACLAPQTPEQQESFRLAFEQETAPLVRANLVLALGILSHAAPETWTFFSGLVTPENDDVVSFSAAVSLARLQKQETPDVVVQLLVHVLVDRPEALDGYRTLPSGGGAPWFAAGWTLTHLGEARTQFLVPSFPALFERAGKWEKSWLADLLVAMFFTEASLVPHESHTRANLTATQLTILNMLADQREIWGLVNFLDRLHAYGLPDSYHGLLAFLGREVPPPVHRPASPSRQSGSTPQSRDILDIFRETLHARYPNIKAHMFQSSSVSNLVTVNDEIIFRVPRRQEEIEAMKREITLLGALQGRVSLSIPNPLYVNDTTREVGRAFMGYTKLPGKPLYKEMFTSIDDDSLARGLVMQIISFLADLHHIPLDALAHLVLPVRHSRENYTNLYARVREVVFPQMSIEERKQASASFETFLDTAKHFAVPLVLIHGAFGPQCILYNARDRALGGILDFTQAGLGDPASDFGRLLGPKGYGWDVLHAGESLYPEMTTLYERIRFYAFASSMQDAVAKTVQQRQRRASGVANRQTFFHGEEKS